MSNFKTYKSQEELENARAFPAKQSSYTERFHSLMQLLKISRMINNTKIVSTPVIKIPS
jgi:hypothetical protein